MLPEGHYLLDGASREHRDVYRYKNGSEIVLAGLDRPGKVLSAEYDVIYIVEATQVSEEVLEFLRGRLRFGTMGWHQLMMDCNPDMEQHWLNRRADTPICRRLRTTLEDNPKWFKNGKWTPAGLEYIKHGLAGMTGHRHARFVLGKWANAEGARFPRASRQVQGFDFYQLFPRGIPKHWKKWLAADWGISDPYCCLWITRSPEGVYYVYHEDYQKGFEANEQACRIVDPQIGSPSNESYEGIWMDSSLWLHHKYAASFGADPEKGSAAKQYWKEFSKPEHKGRFGTMHKGHKDKNERDYIDISAMLDDGSLLISRTCTNLWDELEGAVIWKDPRTGLTFEDQINPGKSKHCPDHALKCLCYGLIRRTPITSEPEKDGEMVDWDEVMEVREEERNALLAEREAGEDVPSWMT